MNEANESVKRKDPASSLAIVRIVFSLSMASSCTGMRDCDIGVDNCASAPILIESI
jgi:hypothetical protein